MAAGTIYGTPLFTDGVLGDRSAQDDLGIEELGGGLLRRFIPGVIANTPNAGYYSFYPYLLWKWQQMDGSIKREDFVGFYRRQEAAFAVACELHEHRDGIRPNGINGAIRASESIRALGDSGSELDLDSVAADYMGTQLGGYGQFYVVALQEARLVTEGAPGLVDRTSEHGEAVASAFAETFDGTTYAQKYLQSPGTVPVAVLRELGEAVCLCSIPGRSDHGALIDTFFGRPLESPDWERNRQTRVESLCLFMEFHDQRPSEDDGDLAAWRRALVEPRFSSGVPWMTSNAERRESWRAYQLRELSVLALTTIWSLYLHVLASRSRATHAELIGELVSWLTDERLGFEPSLTLREAGTTLSEQVPDGYALALEAEPLKEEWREEGERALCRAVRILLRLSPEFGRVAPGFTELLDEGGAHRWSLEHLEGWLDARSETSVTQVLRNLVDALHHQHIRVALSKIRVPSAQNLRRAGSRWRDPFNFAEDDGVLRPLRSDEPSWTPARYSVCNQLLWTLGLLTSPHPPIELTSLGRQTLREHTGDA